MQKNNKKKILLVGNPNVGKSTIFNYLCNRKQKTGNYAGVTVTSLSGNYLYKEGEVEVTDLPGSYSVYPSSEDEIIFLNHLIEQREEYDGIIYIIEALSIKRGMLMLRQIQDLGIPTILVINQIDLAAKKGLLIDYHQLEKNVHLKIVPVNAKKNKGIDLIREAIYQNDFRSETENQFTIPLEFKNKVKEIAEEKNISNPYEAWYLLAKGDILAPEGKSIQSLVSPKRLQTQETIRRYQLIDKQIQGAIKHSSTFKKLITEKLDQVLIHPFWGYLIFFALLLFIFQMVFFIASYPMDWIESFFGWFSTIASENLPAGPLNSLISDGIIPGTGGIIVFAPQILILMYFLYILEDTGYMARVIYLMDRFLRPFGLNGKSIIPLVSGTACAIPAIMSARNIENRKERLLTILVTPFMTCSARLPIYSIIIALIIPDDYFYFIGYRALALLAMYILGFFMALASSFILKKIIRSKMPSFLVIDLPTYKTPLFWNNFKLALNKAWVFITGAGKIIFVVSVIIWVLSYFGPKTNPNEFVAKDVELDHSYLARMGKSIEPAIAPIGFDWKMGVGVLTSFAAREVFVGTMSILYSLDDDAPEEKIIEKMRNDVKPNGDKVFTFATGLSVLVFYAFAMQCISTIAIVYNETKSWRWTLLQTVAMSGIAYFASFIVYHLFR